MNWQKTPKNECCIPSQLSYSFKMSEGKGGKEEREVMRCTLFLWNREVMRCTPFLWNSISVENPLLVRNNREMSQVLRGNGTLVE